MIIKYRGRPLDEGLLKFESPNLQAFPTIRHVKVFYTKASSIHVIRKDTPSSDSAHALKNVETIGQQQNFSMCFILVLNRAT